jgi:hypothetical protein
LQRDECWGKVALRLVSKGLQHPDLNHASHSATCFCGFLEAIQEVHGPKQSAV